MWKPNPELITESIAAYRADQRFAAKYGYPETDERLDDQKLLTAGMLGVHSSQVEQAIAAFQEAQSAGPSALELWLSGG